jgi:hypothetical protein
MNNPLGKIADHKNYNDILEILHTENTSCYPKLLTKIQIWRKDRKLTRTFPCQAHI